jgi:hypothetical protein
MKKLIIVVIAVFLATVTFGQKQNYTEIKPSALPKNATTWIKKNMSQSTIQKAAVSTDKGTTTYLVILEYNGNKKMIRFNKNGEYLGKGTSNRDNPQAKPVQQQQQKTTTPAQADDSKKTTEPIKK